MVTLDVGGRCGQLEAGQGWTSKLAHLPGWQVMQAVIGNAHLGLLQPGWASYTAQLPREAGRSSTPLRAYPQKPPGSLSSYTSLVGAIRNLPRFKERGQRTHLSMEGCHRFLKPCFQITTQVILALFKDGESGASRRSDSAQVPEWNRDWDQVTASLPSAIFPTHLAPVIWKGASGLEPS